MLPNLTLIQFIIKYLFLLIFQIIPKIKKNTINYLIVLDVN